MTTQPATVNFTVYQGARFFKTFTVDFDLTGYTIEMQARFRPEDGEPLSGWDLATTGGSPAIVITVAVSAAVTATFDKAAYSDILFTDGSGNKDYYFEGRLEPNKRITR